MDRIIDIASNGHHLARERGFLTVSNAQGEVARIALDEIAALIVHAHGITWTQSLLARLGEQGVPVVLCGDDHAPRSVLMPLEGHHAQGGRLRAQWTASRPLMKQVWKHVVKCKIRFQAAVMDVGEASAPLTMLARGVTSGDEGNREAQAARYYWPRLMGEDFRREQSGSGPNMLLNYGYTVLRATASRAVVAAGLHPSIGVFHSNRGNAFALADDLMEPFRPLVDCAVRTIHRELGESVQSEAKRRLVSLMVLDLPVGDVTSPISVALTRLATSLGQSFETGRAQLVLPEPPSPLILAGLGK